jgi:hypothetical protein
MSPKKSLMSDKTFNIFITSTCVALAVLTLFLVWQNRNLKDELAELRAPQIPPEALQQGDEIVAMNVLDETGNGVTINLRRAGEKTLLLIFSPDCPACAMTLPIWSELFEDPPASARVFGLRLGAALEGAPVPPFTVYTPDEAGSGLTGKIPFIPTTLLLDDRGVVEQVWYGVLEEEQQEELLGRLAES